MGYVRVGGSCRGGVAMKLWGGSCSGGVHNLGVGWVM